MPERASVFQTVQVGLEVTPGTAPAGGSNRLLQSMQLVPAIDLNVDIFRPMGNKFITLAAPSKELSAAAVQGKLTYTEIVYPLSSLFGAATIVGPNSDGAYVWTFNPASTAADAFSTFSVQGGNAVRAQQYNFGLFTSLGISGSRDGWDINGAMMGQAITDGITMTTSPTAIALQPVLGKHVSVFYDLTSAGLGTTKLGRVLQLAWNFGDKYSPLWAVDQAQASFVAMVEKAPTPTLQLLVEADAAGMALLTDARAGSTAYVRFQATGNLIAGATSYSLRLDTAVKHVKPTPYRNQNDVYAIGFNLQMAHDQAWGTGRSLQAVVTNVLAAL